jgi:hypothetical protein
MTRRSQFGFGCLGLLSLLFLISQFAPSSKQATARQPVAVPAAPIYSEPKLELGSWSWSSGYGYATAEGLVTNISGESLKNVQAVVSFHTKSGEFVSSGDALIDYNPILPGQTSPFKVMARHNPEMHHAEIDFKALMGGTIEWRNASPKPRKTSAPSKPAPIKSSGKSEPVEYAAADTTVYLTPSFYHRAGCPMLDKDDLITETLGSARERKGACPQCNPPRLRK